MNFQIMSKQRKFILIAALVGIISMFLPWVSVSIFGYTQSVNGMHGNGILVFLCFAASGIMAYLGDQTKNLEKTMWTLTLVAGAVAALIVLWNIIDASGNPLGNFLGFGIYLSAVAAVGVLLSAFLFRSSTDTIKGGFDSLKNEIESKMKNSSGMRETTTTNSVTGTRPTYIDTNIDTKGTDETVLGKTRNNLDTESSLKTNTTDSNLPL